jgi:response regulator of citrate/malate metabolism
VISTLIIDDDYRVAEIHAAFVARVDGFEVAGIAHSASEADAAMAAGAPELLLLDLYLPDQHGFELLRRLQDVHEQRPDVIVITASRDVDSVRTAMQLGAVHYLVKPFGFDQLSDRLTAYRRMRENLESMGEASQKEVDALYGMLRPVPAEPAKAASGPATMGMVLRLVKESGSDVTAADVAASLGISRATAQRYLSQLVSRGQLELQLRYGAAGRPAHRYRVST